MLVNAEHFNEDVVLISPMYIVQNWRQLIGIVVRTLICSDWVQNVKHLIWNAFG